MKFDLRAYHTNWVLVHHETLVRYLKHQHIQNGLCSRQKIYQYILGAWHCRSDINLTTVILDIPCAYVCHILLYMLGAIRISLISFCFQIPFIGLKVMVIGRYWPLCGRFSGFGRSMFCHLGKKFFFLLLLSILGHFSSNL